MNIVMNAVTNLYGGVNVVGTTDHGFRFFFDGSEDYYVRYNQNTNEIVYCLPQMRFQSAAGAFDADNVNARDNFVAVIGHLALNYNNNHQPNVNLNNLINNQRHH